MAISSYALRRPFDAGFSPFIAASPSLFDEYFDALRHYVDTPIAAMLACTDAMPRCRYADAFYFAADYALR